MNYIIIYNINVISLVFNFIFENANVTFVTFVTLRCGVFS